MVAAGSYSTISLLREWSSISRLENKWDFYPFKILFALYKSWVDQEQICSNPLGRNKFIKTIASMADAKRIPNWYCPGRKHPVRPKRMMASEEPLMSAYNIDITHYLGKETYTGIHRIRK